METLGGLGGYGITSIIVIFIAFMLFAKFAKKNHRKYHYGRCPLLAPEYTGNYPYELDTMNGIIVALFGTLGTLILAILDILK